MPSQSQEIEGVLRARLQSVQAIPEISWADYGYKPKPRTPFVEVQFKRDSGRPNTMGENHFVYHEGRLMVTLVYPSGGGSGDMTAMGDAVKAEFHAGTTMWAGEVGLSTGVSIRYATSQSAMHEADWSRLPIEIGWYLYSTVY